MKLVEAYHKHKKKYKNELLLLFSGSFVITFWDDAALMNYLFDYQVINDKVGFPISTIEKVKSVLSYHHISYVIIHDGEEERIKSNPNHYLKILRQARELLDLRKRLDCIYSLVENKISENSSNYYKIMEFLDEL